MFKDFKNWKISVALLSFLFSAILYYFKGEIGLFRELNNVAFIFILLIFWIILTFVFEFIKKGKFFQKTKLNRYYKKLQSRDLSDFDKSIIKESIEFNELENTENHPLVVDRKHLMHKDYWKSWAFSIVILLKNKLVLSKRNDQFTLKVNLKEENVGIYNNSNWSIAVFKAGI